MFSFCFSSVLCPLRVRNVINMPTRSLWILQILSACCILAWAGRETAENVLRKWLRHLHSHILAPLDIFRNTQSSVHVRKQPTCSCRLKATGWTRLKSVKLFTGILAWSSHENILLWNVFSTTEMLVLLIWSCRRCWVARSHQPLTWCPIDFSHSIFTLSWFYYTPPQILALASTPCRCEASQRQKDTSHAMFEDSLQRLQ